MSLEYTKHNITVLSTYVLIHVVLWKWVVWAVGSVIYCTIYIITVSPIPSITGLFRTDCGGDHTCGIVKLLFTLYHADSQPGSILREVSHGSTCLGVFVGALFAFLTMMDALKDDPNPNSNLELSDDRGKLIPWKVVKHSVTCQLLITAIWHLIILLMHMGAVMSDTKMPTPDRWGMDSCCNLLRPIQ